MTRRRFHPWPVGIVGLALAFYGLVLLGVQAYAQTLSKPGKLMNAGRSPTSSGSGFAILTEGGDIITTESGDPLRTE